MWIKQVKKILSCIEAVVRPPIKKHKLSEPLPNYNGRKEKATYCKSCHFDCKPLEQKKNDIVQIQKITGTEKSWYCTDLLRVAQIYSETYSKGLLPLSINISTFAYKKLLNFNFWSIQCTQGITGLLNTSSVTKPSITLVKWSQYSLVSNLSLSWF